MMRSGLAEQLINDVLNLTQLELEILPPEPEPENDPQRLMIPLHVGQVTAAYLLGPRDLEAPQRASLKRLLEFVSEALAHRILHHQAYLLEGAIPGPVVAASRILRERAADEALSLSQVAEEIGIGAERLSRLFHQNLGVTFSDYLNVVRLERCRTLLQEGELSITETAFASGYQSISQFNRRFKAAEGVSPREYQRRHGHPEAS